MNVEALHPAIQTVVTGCRSGIKIDEPLRGTVSNVEMYMTVRELIEALRELINEDDNGLGVADMEVEISGFSAPGPVEPPWISHGKVLL